MKFIKGLFKVIGIILLTAIALVLLAWGGLHVAKYFLYVDYYADATAVSPLPDINEGFVPQGLGYDTASKTYFHSGYNGEAVVIHMVDEKDTVKTLYPIYENATEPAKGHGGGIAVAGDYVYLADNADEGDGKFGALNIFKLSDLQNAKDGETVKAVGTQVVDSSASFCFVGGDHIYVGEFYRAESYETKAEHHFITPAGDQNKAILTAYALAEDGSLATDTPEFAVSITDQVQGFGITENGKIFLSRSWGMNNSTLTVYSGWTDNGDTITLSENEIPLYYLDSATEIEEIDMPAFSEGIALIDGDTIAISFESACNKYIIGKLFFATNVVSYPAE